MFMSVQRMQLLINAEAKVTHDVHISHKCNKFVRNLSELWPSFHSDND